MCKSEYKLIRKMQWDGDVLKVQDTMNDVLREAKQAAEDAMTGAVLSHFECDLSDIREYMHDKIKWEQKQWAAMPRWIPVTERLPESKIPVNIVWVNHAPASYYAITKNKPFVATGIFFFGEWYWWSATTEDYLNEYGRCEWDKVDGAIEITHWMPLPEPPEEKTVNEITPEMIEAADQNEKRIKERVDRIYDELIAEKRAEIERLKAEIAKKPPLDYDKLAENPPEYPVCVGYKCWDGKEANNGNK